MSPGKLAYNEVQQAADEWVKVKGYDPWRSAFIYVQAHLGSWLGPQAEKASRAAHHGWRMGNYHHTQIRIVSGLVPCLVGILIAYLQLGYGKSDSIKWLLTSAGSAVAALVALFETLGGSTEKDLSAGWKELFDKLITRIDARTSSDDRIA